MKLGFDKKIVGHVKRHLIDAPELGGKFNVKIKNVEEFLKILGKYLEAHINIENLTWFHNNISGTDTAEIFLKADSKLKNLFGILPDEPFGYDGVIEITEEFRGTSHKNTLY